MDASKSPVSVEQNTICSTSNNRPRRAHLVEREVAYIERHRTSYPALLDLETSCSSGSSRTPRQPGPGEHRLHSDPVQCRPCRHGPTRFQSRATRGVDGPGPRAPYPYEGRCACMWCQATGLELCYLGERKDGGIVCQLGSWSNMRAQKTDWERVRAPSGTPGVMTREVGNIRRRIKAFNRDPSHGTSK
ncbi:hypothetical protein BD779DRAFT_224889 [Infundibulicybe gibba]|nr:hypothetical protein BD779DRAFT_224889 [Infundibulicybe gibba]